MQALPAGKERSVLKIIETILTTEGHRLEKQGNPRVTPDITTENQVLNVYREVKKQTWLGFGSALTDAAAWCYAHVPPENQKEILRLYFSKDEGLGYDWGRMHIGSCDFSTCEYAYTKPEDRTLESFDLGQDKVYILPMVQDILKVNPELFLFASPWSPPSWMKTTGNTRFGGKLRDDWKDVWARYVARYLKSYEAEGVAIEAVTVQNEPAAAQTWESCQYTADDEAELIRDHLAPVFEQEGLTTKIIIWDHNKERVYERARDTLRDPAVREKVWGVGFHWYSGGHFDGLALTHEMFPEKELIATEFCYGMTRKNDGALGYARDILHNMNSGMTASVDWNLLLDETGGPYHYRPTGCAAPVMVNTQTGEVTCMPMYDGVAHFARYIPKGSRRLATSTYDNNVALTAFERPDGKVAVVILNDKEESAHVFLRMDNHTAPMQLPGRSLTTVLIEE